MKKIILVIALIMLTVTTSYGQYNKWSVSGEYGNQMVDDKTAISIDKFDHFGLGLRYNINDMVGVGLTGGYDKTVLSEDNGLTEYDFKYSRLNAEGYLNAFKILDIYSKRFTVLFHGGPGVSVLNGDGYEQKVLNIRGGSTLLFKISNRIALSGDFSITSNINQLSKFDGSGPSVNTGINSNVSNASIGLTFYLGKKKQPHADWYKRPDIVPVINNLTEVVNNTYPVTEYDETNIIDIIKNYITLQPNSEYVFFLHDKSDIRDSELNAIQKVYAQLEGNPTWKVVIKGYASPTSSSSEYNQKLSERRSNEVLNKLVGMGIDSKRISVTSYGKDVARSDENVHDVARRVELLVTK